MSLSRCQVPVALAALLIVVVVDLLYLRNGEPAQPQPSPSGGQNQTGDVVWPERAYRALVVDLAVDPRNPLALTRAERLDAHRRIREMEAAAVQVVWATARILDLLDTGQLEEFDRLHHDLRARALLFRLPIQGLTEEVVASLRARTRDGRVAAPLPVPPGWEPDRDETATYQRWLDKTRAWSQRRLAVDRPDASEVDANTPSTDMLDVSPQEVLLVLDRLQDDPNRALQGPEASRMAGYARLLGGSVQEMDTSWESLHWMTTTEERTKVKRERQRTPSDDVSMAGLAQVLRRARNLRP